jgi:hypothetical protein
VRAWANAHQVPVIECKRGERKHQLAEEYLASHSVGPGVFLILVARASAAVWALTRSRSGVIVNLAKKMAFVNHYSFHIMDPQWGHVTIKMSGHPPFAAQVILNGHEYVAAQAGAAGIGFTQQGNCFTAVADPAGLAQVADTLSQQATVGRLSQVCDQWIYSACLCFGLDLAEQTRSGFRYEYAVYQAEYTPQPDIQSGRSDGEGVRPHRRSDPVPAGRAYPAHAVRRQTTPGPQRQLRALASARSHDRDTSV